jgi:hypothetical protein
VEPGRFIFVRQTIAGWLATRGRTVFIDDDLSDLANDHQHLRERRLIQYSMLRIEVAP